MIDHCGSSSGLLERRQGRCSVWHATCGGGVGVCRHGLRNPLSARLLRHRDRNRFSNGHADEMRRRHRLGHTGDEDAGRLEPGRLGLKQWHLLTLHRLCRMLRLHRLCRMLRLYRLCRMLRLHGLSGMLGLHRLISRLWCHGLSSLLGLHRLLMHLIDLSGVLLDDHGLKVALLSGGVGLLGRDSLLGRCCGELSSLRLLILSSRVERLYSTHHRSLAEDSRWDVLNRVDGDGWGSAHPHFGFFPSLNRDQRVLGGITQGRSPLLDPLLYLLLERPGL